jgi:DNA-directed RNA polymerase sigma subunit (sigma70/sigma32)
MVESITYGDIGDENGSYEDFPTADSATVRMLAAKLARNMLATCSRRDAGIMRLFFGIGQCRPYSAVEIGRKLRLTHQRVSQIVERQIHLIRRAHCPIVH